MSTHQSIEPIAVVGMACRLPGAANPDEFWRMIVAGHSAIGPVPESRLDRSLYYNPQKGVVGATYADQAALVDYTADLTPDALFSAKEINEHDAAAITCCRVAGEALAKAGWNPRPEARTGVYIGHATGSGVAGRYSYGVHGVQSAHLLKQADGFDQLPPHVQQAVLVEAEAEIRSSALRRTRDHNPDFESHRLARLISEKFSLSGPSMVLNSACASSLQAIAHGMMALSLGRIDAAVVGGASCFNSDTLVLFSAAQSLSAVGSHPFTEGADGLIVGEGYVVFVLKTLAAAEAADDRIVAVLPGVGVSSDGKGKSLWAPRGEGQVEAIQRAYNDPAAVGQLDYIEAHATSTNLGDKTEIASLAGVLEDRLPAGVKIPIGGVKRNVGHTLEVAGATGLLKTILAMRERTIPPAVDGSRPLTNEVDWPALPVYVNNAPIAWPARSGGGPLRAAVNAFGIGGLNVHLAVESYAPQPIASPPKPKATRPPIAIVGLGVVAPGANDYAAFAELLRTGRSAIGPYPSEKWERRLFDDSTRLGEQSIPLEAAACVTDWEYDWRKHRIPPKQLAQASPLQFMMLDAVDQALGQSGLLESEQFDRKRAGVLVGSQFGGDFATQLLMGLRRPVTRRTLASALQRQGVPPAQIDLLLDSWAKQLLEHFPALVDEAGSFTASALASRITKSFDLMGGGVAVDSGNLGGFAALDAAIDTLATGCCDTMVVVAGEHALTPESYLIAELSGQLNHNPRDPAQTLNGIIPGVGCVALVLKRLQDARSVGSRLLGVIDATGVAAAADHAEASRAAIQAARSTDAEQSSVPAAVCLMGTGKQELDKSEISAATQSYNAPSSLPATSPSERLGHLGSGAGFVAMAASLVALEDQKLGDQPITTSDPAGRLRMAVSAVDPNNLSYHVILQRGAPVNPQPSSPNPSSAQIERLSSGAILFDATARRRDKMRAAATGVTPQAQAPATPVAPPAPTSPPAATNGYHPPAAAPPAAPAAPPAAAPEPVSQPASAALSAEEVQTFLVNFVVEQTGYPKEIVDLDADLEADLGIDSIKKAQLLGELGEYFDVQVDATTDLSLDDFPSLRSVRDYLLANGSEKGAAEPSMPAAPTAQPIAQPPAPVAVQPAAPAAPASPPSAPAPASATTQQSSALSAEEVETFLVNFVVEQTGYPQEIVDLDADLEADLGIDSIKKAQLLGELGEYFDVQVDATTDLSLDDFPSLRSVRDYLLANGSEKDAPQAASTPATPTPAAAPQTAAPSPPVATDFETLVIEFVMDQTGYPREVVDLDGDFEIDLGIDDRKLADMLAELAQRHQAPALASTPVRTLREVVEQLSRSAAATSFA